jgi:uncharacterized protein YjbJ (UPF0337 family)
MGAKDKISNETQHAKGKAEEVAGKMTDDKRLEAEGRTDQATAKAKKAGEKAKDAVNDVKDAARDTIRR